MSAAPLRVGVVGAGPKALFALQELCALWPGASRIRVDLFDPAEPGGGAVWEPELPLAWRLNAPAAMVDARGPGWDLPLSAWLRRHHPEHAEERFPPRALVGAYLRQAFAALAADPRVEVRHHRSRVMGLGTGPGQIDPSAYDEVLLATGHAGLPAQLRRHAEAVPAGATATVRGAALTGLDALLLLTESRGGRWSRIPEDSLARLTYHPSGHEPARVVLRSRTGAVMAPKPEHQHSWLEPVVTAAAAQVRAWGAQVRARPAGDPVSLSPLWGVLLGAVGEAARAAGVSTTPLRLWRAALTGSPVRDAAVSPGRQQAAYLSSRLAIDAGAAPPDELWLWGRIWPGVYRDLVQALDRLPRSARDQFRFRRVAGTLERVSFGPPAETVRKFLALLECGRAEVVATGDDAREPDTAEPAASDPKVSARELAALTAGPGVLTAPAPAAGAVTTTPSAPAFLDPLYADLFRRGLITVRPGERGVLTDPDATCLDAHGRRVEGVAVLGRPTEDPVLGHDTLDRTLHGDGPRWARGVVARWGHRALQDASGLAATPAAAGPRKGNTP